MTREEYLEEIKEDVLEYIGENINYEDFDDLEELEEKLYDDCFTEDSVTGNGSGSYYFSKWKAAEAIGNIFEDDVLLEACQEFCGDLGEWIEKGAEHCDVCIRCYLLGEAIAEAIEEIADDFEEAHEDEEETGYHVEHINKIIVEV